MIMKKGDKIMRKILCLVILLTMSISSINIYATKEQVAAFIPVKMQPNSTITYNDDLTYEIEIASVKPVTIKHTVEDEERKAEEEFIRQIKKEDKDLPRYKLITVLPKPFPGMRVIYGSDGGD